LIEAKLEKLEPYRQVEIRRPSEESYLEVLGITKPAGYYFDIVWLPVSQAVKGSIIRDEDDNEWTIAVLFGTMLRHAFRMSFRKTSTAAVV
jgi:hypothetical protein